MHTTKRVARNLNACNYACVLKSTLTYGYRIPDHHSECVEGGWKVPPAWFVLKEDPVLDAFDSTKQEFPGSLLFSLR